MSWPLVLTFSNYVDIISKSSLLIDPAAKKWSKITLYILSKKTATIRGFRIVVWFLNIEVVAFITNIITPARYRTIRHHQSKNWILSITRILYLLVLAHVDNDDIHIILQKNETYM